ncbi:MAG: RNA 2',3'-cyclic phosphodiesterase [Actinomycetota bacterium]|nr:RNA 2',3'-cyclic phosphodiesterase [Actinomycetota bacterium]
MRAFFAVELSDAVREALAGVRDSVISADPQWRSATWVASENLHVTVKFLGDIDEATASGLCDSLAWQLACELPPRLTFTGLRAVPGARRARMLWATLDDEDGLLARVAAVVEVASPATDVESGRRPFSPHVTLVRARRPMSMSEEPLKLAENHLFTMLSAGRRAMSVPSITLVRSTLTRNGPIYETISSIAVGSD